MRRGCTIDPVGAASVLRFENEWEEVSMSREDRLGVSRVTVIVEFEREHNLVTHNIIYVYH